MFYLALTSWGLATWGGTAPPRVCRFLDTVISQLESAPLPGHLTGPSPPPPPPFFVRLAVWNALSCPEWRQGPDTRGHRPSPPHSLPKLFKLANPKPALPVYPAPASCKNHNKDSCLHFAISPSAPDHPRRLPAWPCMVSTLPVSRDL